jgi:hypothetical protein
MEPVEIDVSAHSSATPSTVYEVAKNSEAYPRWSRIGSFEHMRDGALERYGVGSQRIYRTWPLTLLEEVVELIPDRSVGYVLLSGLPLRGYRANIDLSPSPGGGTAIRWHNHFYTTVPGTRWCFKWFMQMVLDEMAPQLAREAERIEKALQSASNLS